MLSSGRMLVFDNGPFRGYSRVLEIDPLSGSILWSYGEEPRERFHSPYLSGAQRLPNGNTLICEGQSERLFEVTPNKEIVWDFHSPFVGQAPQHLGKRIHRATRYSPAQVEPLLASREDQIVSEVDPDGRRIRTLAEVIELYQSV